MNDHTLPILTVAPAQVVRGDRILATQAETIAGLGHRPLVVGGKRALEQINPLLASLARQGLELEVALAVPGCTEAVLAHLRSLAQTHRSEVILGVGGGKALDTAKLLAYGLDCPVVTIPTSAATCAAWTALSNVYSEEGAFRYDVALPRCPERLILDYDVIRTAPPRTLVAGIGDGLAKWYEAAVSSGACDRTLVVAAVQQARVLRDILLQKTAAALKDWGGEDWRQVVDATVLLAGVVGGIGGAQCRTVAAHAVHNGLTQLPNSQASLHGEKVAYGILVQLRLEEMEGRSALAATARQQLVSFYQSIGLPSSLTDLGLADLTLADLQKAAEFACRQGSDIYHLPFTVTPDVLVAAMVSPLGAALRESPYPLSSSSTAISELQP
ncbi:MAG: iron-containing alcohol dehydrogenase family protein [Nodosilinea sp.]